jgi:ferredoxin
MSQSYHLIAYCSPGGSTKDIAKTILNHIKDQGARAERLDLTDSSWRQEAERLWKENGPPACIWLGSPVYAQHIVPPAVSFLKWLPDNPDSILAVPFVTWGAVTSGTALYETGRKLRAKGYLLAGAAKVVAEHSSLWRSDEPLGAARPNEADRQSIRQLVENVSEKLLQDPLRPISLSALDYQPAWQYREADQVDIEKAKARHPGFHLREELCTQCGTCRDICPAGAIELDSYPEIDDSCFLCNNCVRYCPEGAMQVDTSALEEHIHHMADRFREKTETRIFV